MDGEHENPYASSSATVVPQSTNSHSGGRHLLWIYITPLLMSIGISTDLLLHVMLSSGEEAGILVQWLLFLLTPLALAGLLAMTIGWVPAIAQLVVAGVRFARGEPSWKHHFASVVLIAICYGIWIWIVNRGIVSLA